MAQTMPTKYKAVPVDKLVDLPSRMQSKRAEKLADAITVALNEMAEKGWELTTSWRSVNGTILIFRKAD